MGTSHPPTADVDLVHSVARRVEGSVEIVLARPRVPLGPGDEIVLRRRGAEVVGRPVSSGSGDGARTEVRVPADDLGDGVWTIDLRRTGEAGPTASLGCRLLVQGRRPVVLLWGAETTASMRPVPHPRSAGPRHEHGADRGHDVRTRARRAAASIIRRARRSV